MRITLVGSLSPSSLPLNEHTAFIASSLARIPEVSTTIVADIGDGTSEVIRNPSVKIVRCWRKNSLLGLLRICQQIVISRPNVVWFNLVFTVFSDQPIRAFVSLLMPATMRLLGYKVVVTLHAPVEVVDFGMTKHKSFIGVKRRGAQLAQWFLLRANLVFVFLNRYADLLRKSYGAKNVVKMHHGFEDGEKSSINECNRRRILVFGRFGGYKRLEPAIEIFTKLKSVVPDVELTIAGSSHPSYPSYFSSIKDQFSSIKGLKFEGYIPESELERLFNGHSIVWLPYQSSTGVSGVAHRACRFGCPLVLPDLPDFVEMVKDEGISAEIYDGDSLDAAVEALKGLLCDRGERSRMSVHNAAVARLCPTEKIVKSYVELFKKHF